MEKLSLLACDRTLDLALSLVDVLVSCKELYREAFLLARTTQRPAYDGFYLALVQREDAALLTMDGALKREALRQGIRIVQQSRARQEAQRHPLIPRPQPQYAC
ncbi:MAG: type II toxin-antitoxin system VapC family toxin [Acidobacteriota bacterium]|nr:type II toxin-antitoxin system VapC family toxin [Acidobacteriota bacterium]